MATITVRNLDDEVQKRLKKRAAANDRSMEAEARAILSNAVAGADFAAGWLEAIRATRGDILPIPGRSVPRNIDIE